MKMCKCIDCSGRLMKKRGCVDWDNIFDVQRGMNATDCVVFGA